ncbi:hypothetical protein BFJ63_vAg18827 [Fusarium oxysporum f. sp. narcissi]|uniref:Uncharacterized protein n=1 Tax=Fusarium oxysporum f. sp. narcissi TaxID=451672 RepID=A0A4Q2UVH4_FUSOX|nr:hypothetical protein BFJ63_vAg18827 [Fusarium oxysporum f. sp. narcissi]
MQPIITLILAFQAATVSALTTVVCIPASGAKIGDAEWAITNRKNDLHLNDDGFWNGGITTCGGQQVVALCRSKDYSQIWSTILKNGVVMCFKPELKHWYDCNQCK